MRFQRFRAVFVGLFGCVLGAPALATTWIVDYHGGPGIDFVNIQDAVDAAVDGDVIEVRPGPYPAFTIDGKSLVVRGITSPFPGTPRIAPGVLVTNIDASRSVEITSVSFVGLGGPELPTLTLMQNSGPVRLVDCGVSGKQSFARECVSMSDLAQDAVSVASSDEVTFLRCDLRGGWGDTYTYYYDCGFDGGAGLRGAAQSRIVVLESQILGGPGGRGGSGVHGGIGTGGRGGDAALLTDGSTLLVHESFIRGGGAGQGGCDIACAGPPCVIFQGGGNQCPGGVPGYGVLVLDSSNLSHKDSDIGSISGSAQEVAIAPFCLGTFEECPCNNNGAGVAGCEHSFGLGGGRLEGVGNASVSADTVTLQLTGLNPNAAPTGLLFQAQNLIETMPFRDGLLCTTGSTLRLEVRAASNGAIAYGFGQPGSASISSLAGLPPTGARRRYQVLYRNQNASFCTPQRYNLSNGVDIRWGP